jgi:hypothetical protein
MSEQRTGIVPRYTVAWLLAVLLTITSPLHAVVCSMSECSTADSRAKVQCHAMEMAKQPGPSCAAPTLPCCERDQTPNGTVQPDVGLQSPDGTLTSTDPENPSPITIEIQTAISPQSDGPPPDRQSLFCTLLI